MSPLSERKEQRKRQTKREDNEECFTVRTIGMVIINVEPSVLVLVAILCFHITFDCRSGVFVLLPYNLFPCLQW